MKPDEVTKTLMAALLVVALVSCGKNEPPAPSIETPAATPAASAPAQTTVAASGVEPGK